MWNNTTFEELLKTRLKEQLDETKAGDLWAIYESTRNKVVNHILKEIPAKEPNLSDHSADHVRDVLQRAGHLIGTKESSLSAIDLYCLAQMILFHDTGNIYGRLNHHRKVAEIFDWARGVLPETRREKTIVIKAVQAHTGRAADGSFDTLKDLATTDHVYDETVRPQELAAILRFADEMAEGPHRTSAFRQEKNMHHIDNQIYHDYASITNGYIDRGNGRILLTYEIDIRTPPEGMLPEHESHAAKLLNYVYERIVKLDQERRYTSFYSKVLMQYRETRAVINFQWNGKHLLVDLPPIVLENKVIPGDFSKTVPDLHGEYHCSQLLPLLTNVVNNSMKDT